MVNFRLHFAKRADFLLTKAFCINYHIPQPDPNAIKPIIGDDNDSKIVKLQLLNLLDLYQISKSLNSPSHDSSLRLFQHYPHFTLTGSLITHPSALRNP
jgi:hypothetical protein